MILSRKELFETQGTITISAKASEPAFHDISLIPDKVVIILNISKNDSAAKLVGEVLAGINEQCDRCLKNFKKEIQGTFELIVFDDRHSEQKSNNSSINVLTLGKDSIDISSIIRESIFLEKPQVLIGHLLPHTNNHQRQCAAECPPQAELVG